MNIVNFKNISLALLITLTAMFSVNSHTAEKNNIEDSLTEMVVAQSQQLMTDLAIQLQQAIAEELSDFRLNLSFEESIQESLAWLIDEQKSPAMVEVKQSEVPKIKQ